MTEQTILSDKEAIREWFADTVYEQSILIELVIDKSTEKIVFITSCSTEPLNRYQYRFRKVTFYDVKDLTIGKFLYKQLANNEYQEDIRYNSGSRRGTYIIERIQLKTYPDYFTIHLNFGDSNNSVDFRFSGVAIQERLGIYQKSEEIKILDLQSRQDIKFDKPFE
ncbi:hypothetical protein Q0590_23035 [Rhodocytophaga aerolata]|uniref:Uncharacterized protein n=1 Tax=Rhodocytophaga aerolata TaxID=455078 RepID=A0ABT8REK7_9BACT|nr:hypothetical protein [Rhodocytophaga aerolata]MDO1449170.1 hypothetical protein [Rhodocytophaga aerolata]